jgi:hypothetical protein
MKFELIVPKTEKYSEDDIVAGFIAEYQERMRGDWPVIPQKYVTYGEGNRPGEVDLSITAGEIASLPQKEADGKWYVDVMLYKNEPANSLKEHLPLFKKFGCPVKVKLDVFTDGNVVMGPMTLSFFAEESFCKIQPVQKCIYVLQAFCRYKLDEEHPDRDDRNIGWYSTLDAAIENLHANKDVIAETMPDEDGVDYPYYQYALIEKVPEGPYACGMENEDDAVKFFEWKDGDYVEMDRPKELEGVVGFTVG